MPSATEQNETQLSAVSPPASTSRSGTGLRAAAGRTPSGAAVTVGGVQSWESFKKSPCSSIEIDRGTHVAASPRTIDKGRLQRPHFNATDVPCSQSLARKALPPVPGTEGDRAVT